MPQQMIEVPADLLQDMANIIADCPAKQSAHVFIKLKELEAKLKLQADQKAKYAECNLEPDGK